MESKALKRKHEELEVDEVESLDEPLSTASVHGVISSLSPIKKGRKTNYFDGSVCNRKGTVRLVGFSPSQQNRIKRLMDSKQPVKIEDCEVRQGRRGQKMEIVLKSTTKIGASPRKFDFSTIVTDDAITTLSDIDSKGVFDRVSVNVKVNKVHAPSEVATGKKKQDIMLVDRSASVRCVLWEEKIGSLKEGKCYFLKNFVVREYGSRFLSMAKEGCEIVEIEDIGETIDEDVPQDDDEMLLNAEIVAVAHLDLYRSCLRCKARVEPVHEGFARCSKDDCKMLQKYNVSPQHISAKLLFKTDSAIVSLYAHGQTVRDLVAVDDSHDVTEDRLLHVPILHKVRYNKQYTITEVQR